MPTTMFSARLDKDLLQRARSAAQYRKTTVSALITNALLQRVEEIEDHRKRYKWDTRVEGVDPHHSHKDRQISPSLRERIRDKYDNTCQECGITEEQWKAKDIPHPHHRLHVAHIEPICNFVDPADAHHEPNLTLLCPSCHSKQHKIKSEYVDYTKEL